MLKSSSDNRTIKETGFTGPSVFLSVNVRGPVYFAVSALATLRAGFEVGTHSPVDWMPAHKMTAIEDQDKTWSQQSVAMNSKHSATKKIGSPMALAIYIFVLLINYIIIIIRWVDTNIWGHPGNYWLHSGSHLTPRIQRMKLFFASRQSAHPFQRYGWLTLKHRERHGCVVSTVATDALVLKHQAISIHNAD